MSVQLGDTQPTTACRAQRWRGRLVQLRGQWGDSSATFLFMQFSINHRWHLELTSHLRDRFHQNQKGRKAAEKLGFVEWKLSYFCVNEYYPWGNKFSLAWIYKSWQQRQEVTKTIVRSTVLWTCFQPGKAGFGQKEMFTESDWWLVFIYQKYFPQNTTPVFCIIVFAKLILKGHDVSYGLEFDFTTWVFIELICTSKKKIKRRNYTIWMNFTSHVNVNDPTTLMLR